MTAGDAAAIETLARHGVSVDLWTATGARLAMTTNVEEAALEAAFDAAMIASRNDV